MYPFSITYTITRRFVGRVYASDEAAARRSVERNLPYIEATASREGDDTLRIISVNQLSSEEMN